MSKRSRDEEEVYDEAYYARKRAGKRVVQSGWFRMFEPDSSDDERPGTSVSPTLQQQIHEADAIPPATTHTEDDAYEAHFYGDMPVYGGGLNLHPHSPFPVPSFPASALPVVVPPDVDDDDVEEEEEVDGGVLYSRPGTPLHTGVAVDDLDDGVFSDVDQDIDQAFFGPTMCFECDRPVTSHYDAACHGGHVALCNRCVIRCHALANGSGCRDSVYRRMCEECANRCVVCQKYFCRACMQPTNLPNATPELCRSCAGERVFY